MLDKCALIDPNGNCRLLRQKAVDNCHCPHYTAVEPAVCRFCGQPSLDTMLFEASNGEWEHICGNCKQKTGTCYFCEKSEQNCALVRVSSGWNFPSL